MFRHKITRREAVKTVFWGTVLSCTLHRTWSEPALNEISAFVGDEPATLKVRLSDFPALAQPFGSIRLGTSAISVRTNMPVGLYYPVIISRGENDDFYAVSAECTHAGCTVRTLDFQDKLLACPCHGSRYAMDGTVVQDPAFFPLTRFELRLSSSGELLIEIPNLFLNVAVTNHMPAGNGRVALRFLSFSNIEYEIRSFTDLESPDEVVPFASTPEGAVDQTSLMGIDDYTTIYLPRPGSHRFFQPVMKVRQV